MSIRTKLVAASVLLAGAAQAETVACLRLAPPQGWVHAEVEGAALTLTPAETARDPSAKKAAIGIKVVARVADLDATARGLAAKMSSEGMKPKVQESRTAGERSFDVRYRDGGGDQRLSIFSFRDRTYLITAGAPDELASRHAAAFCR